MKILLRWIGFLLLLIVQGISTEEDIFGKCCKLGTSWAEQKLRCEKFSGPVTGVNKNDQSACLETVEICCRKAFQQQECDLGKSDAKAGLSCTKSSTGQRKKPIGLGEIRRDCCEGCKLGIKTGSSSKSCEKKVSFGEPWDPAFTECCEEKLTTTTRAKITKTTKKNTITTSTTVTTEDDEFNELFKEITDPIFTTQGDLCQLMKGLLCSDICVPTPGSYYCKCREGSVLQSDGRSCESPTTTTKKVTKKTTKSTPKTTTTKSTPKITTTTTKSTPKITTTKSTPKPTTTKSTSKPTTKKSQPKNTKKDTVPPLTTLKLLTSRAKTRTTRALTTEDNELNQSCPSGYRFNPSSNTCDDIDECNEPTTSSQQATCPLDTQCRNNNGSYDCLANNNNNNCQFGYRWNSTYNRCIDVDECMENTHKCIAETENCRNLEGSFECEVKCDTGYIFNRFYAACLDVNECSEQLNPCSSLDTICVNTLGSYECKNLQDYPNYNESSYLARNNISDYDAITDEGTHYHNNVICDHGYTYNTDTKVCDDIDECELLSQACSQGEICRNTIGGYDCIPAGCHRGFKLINDTICMDIDECEENLHSCLTDEICRNINGSFTCEPPRPTMRPSTTERPEIICRKGYKADYRLDGCVDIDECVEGPGCRDHERCINFQGTYDCSPLCGSGWYFDLETKTCQDVDECMLGIHNCRQRTQYCHNTNGSYTCEPLEVCTSGYRRSQNGSCIDIDECQESLHSCSRESHRYCINHDGGYECITRLPSCSPGFIYSLLTQHCQDIDECRNGKANCDKTLNERCINLPGTYKCERIAPQLRRIRPACPNGTRYDVKLRMCADIDECNDGSHDCGPEKCYNLPGSFECAKAVLPIIKRRTTTTDHMESRSHGDHSCSAGSKYDNERKGCVDVDECKEIKDVCGSYEDCRNTPGSFECTCKRGFHRDNFTQACVDINECLQDNDCFSYQRCDNTIGSYVCVRFLSCGTGYTLNAATEFCEDDDECLMGTHNCPRGWHCHNTQGNFRCLKDKKPQGTPRWTTRPPPRVPVTFRTTTTTTTEIPTTTSTTERTTTTTTYKPTTTTTRRITTTTQRPTTTTMRRVYNTTVTPPTTTTSVYKPWSTTYRPWNTTYRPWNTTVRPVWQSTYRPVSSTPRYNLNTTVYVPPSRGRTTTTEFVPTVGPVITSRNWDWTTSTRSPMTCPPGYESGSSGQCIDINECQRNPTICGSFQCINFMGSYKCEHQMLCKIGHRPDPITGECKDVDECAQGSHECGPYQKCQNRPGGYYCFCPQGYEIRGKECIDVNECTRFSPAGICGTHGRCENTQGSYRCICESGFMNDPKSGACIDLDECTSKPNLCEHQCYNTWGGHRCGCNYGYRLRSDNRTCEDIDECTEFKDNNLCIGICENTPGSYACKCPDGYKLAEDARTCQDIDECATNNHCQGAHEICQNVRGSFRCNKINCPTGYIQDPQRKNRCMREVPFCLAQDTACFNRPAHYTYNYIAIVSMFPIPVSGEVELFTMRGAYNVPGSTVNFSMAFITARAPPNVLPATEECFSLKRPFPSQAVLAMTKSLQGPQDIELDLSMEIYSPNGIFAGSAVAKIFIVITQYEF